MTFAESDEKWRRSHIRNSKCEYFEFVKRCYQLCKPSTGQISFNNTSVNKQSQQLTLLITRYIYVLNSKFIIYAYWMKNILSTVRSNAVLVRILWRHLCDTRTIKTDKNWYKIDSFEIALQKSVVLVFFKKNIIGNLY